METKKVFVLIDDDAKFGDFDVTVYRNEEKAVAELRKRIERMMEQQNTNNDVFGNDIEFCVRNLFAYFEDGSYVNLEEKTIVE